MRGDLRKAPSTGVRNARGWVFAGSGTRLDRMGELRSQVIRFRLSILVTVFHDEQEPDRKGGLPELKDERPSQSSH